MPWQVQLADLQSKLGAANMEVTLFPTDVWILDQKAMAISSTKTEGSANAFKHKGILGGYCSLHSLHTDLT